MAPLSTSFSSDERDLAALPVVYALPEVAQVTVRRDLCYKRTPAGALLMDVYTPPDVRVGDPAAGRAAVLFIHGGPVRERPLPPKDRGQYTSWGRLVAAAGFTGITFNHRHFDWTTLHDAAGDIHDLIDYVRSHAATLNVDAARLCLWTCSGGPMVGLRRALRERPDFIRCIVTYYGGLDLQHRRALIPPVVSDDDLRQFSPLFHLEQRSDDRAWLARLAPLFIARAGLDNPRLNDSIDRFVAEALARNVPLTLMTHPHGRHGFDVLDDVPRSHEIIRSTLEFLRAHTFETAPQM